LDAVSTGFFPLAPFDCSLADIEIAKVFILRTANLQFHAPVLDVQRDSEVFDIYVHEWEFVLWFDFVPRVWDKETMPKRSGKKQDLNEKAFSIVRQLTGEEPKPDPDAGKNPAAVALGRLGGLKGGKARAAALSPEARTTMAKKAAKARWSKP
jgi:hypothetical protein